MTQRWNWVEGDWDGSVLTGPVPRHPSLSSLYLVSPSYPYFVTPPLHNLRPGKRNRNQEGGVLEGRGSPPPHTAKTQGAWE